MPSPPSPTSPPVVSPDGPERIVVVTEPPGVRVIVDVETLSMVTPLAVRVWRQRIRAVGHQLFIRALPIHPNECPQHIVVDTSSASPDTVRFQMHHCPTTDEEFDRIFDVVEVDDPPSRLHGSMPDNAFLLQSGEEGTVMMRFVIDTLGAPEAGTLEVAWATNAGFVSSARRAILSSVFKPGRLLGRKVRTRVEMPVTYAFRR